MLIPWSTPISAFILFYEDTEDSFKLKNLQWSIVKQSLDPLNVQFLIVRDDRCGGTSFWVYLDAAPYSMTPKQIRNHEFMVQGRYPCRVYIFDKSENAERKQWVLEQGVLKYDGFSSVTLLDYLIRKSRTWYGTLKRTLRRQNTYMTEDSRQANGPAGPGTKADGAMRAIEAQGYIVPTTAYTSRCDGAKVWKCHKEFQFRL